MNIETKNETITKGEDAERFVINLANVLIGGDVEAPVDIESEDKEEESDDE